MKMDFVRFDVCIKWDFESEVIMQWGSPRVGFSLFGTAVLNQPGS